MGYFLEHFDELTAQDASSWSRIGKLINTKLFFVCLRAIACVCVYVCSLCASQCVRAAPFDHISAHRRHCMVYTLCDECTAVQYSMLSKCAESFSARVVAVQLLALLQF